MLLVDTSIWVEVFRRPPGLALADVADLEEVVTCLPIVQEVLQGFREEPAFRTAREAMLALPIVESPLVSSRLAPCATDSPCCTTIGTSRHWPECPT